MHAPGLLISLTKYQNVTLFFRRVLKFYIIVNSYEIYLLYRKQISTFHHRQSCVLINLFSCTLQLHSVLLTDYQIIILLSHISLNVINLDRFSMTQKQYVDRSYRENRSKSNSNAQSLLRTLRTEKGRKYFRNTAITLLFGLNVFTLYVATHRDMPEHHPFYNFLGKGKKSEGWYDKFVSPNHPQLVVKHGKKIHRPELPTQDTQVSPSRILQQNHVQ